MALIHPYAVRPVRPPVVSVRLRPRTTEIPLASIPARLTAAVLDALLTVGAALPALSLCSATDLTGPSAAFLTGVCVFLLSIIQWFLVATTGQSLGKRWVGIRIVRDDGRSVDLVHGVVLRTWLLHACFAIPVLGGSIAVVDALAIFGSTRRCLHDRIAGTKVITANPYDA